MLAGLLLLSDEKQGDMISNPLAQGTLLHIHSPHDH